MLKYLDQTDLTDYIDSDIKKIKQVIDTKAEEIDLECLKNLHMEIDGRYSNCIQNWGKSMLSYSLDYGFTYGNISIRALRQNLQVMYHKIIGVKASGIIYFDDGNSNNINVSPHISTEISNVNTVQMSIDSVRELIQNMGALSRNESDEILEKINFLEKIIESKDNRKDKWDKGKDILKWLAEKGVDVGIALLPLFLQM